MSTIFSLSLSASILVVMLYPVFYILVNRCRSFRFNRLVMLSGIAIMVLGPIAFAYDPFIDGTSYNIAKEITTIQIGEVSGLNEPAPIAERSCIEFLPGLLLLYWVGIFVLVVRQIGSYIQLWRIIYQSEREQMDGFVLCRHDRGCFAPFSWGKFIVLSSFENEESILIHEKAHTFKKHWIDVLLADFLCIFMWYNPFVWMVKNLIKLNHEFDADAEVIDSNIDVLSYQRLLITKAIDNRTLHVANNFAISKKDFRRRVLIMNKSKSSKWIKWIAAMILPAVAIAAYADTTTWSVRFHDTISNYRFTREVLPTSEIVEESSFENLPQEELPVTLITKRLPSPLSDPEPLLKQFEMSLEFADKDMIPDKILVRIEADEDGNIVSATSDYDDNPEVRLTIDRAINQVVFEVVKDGDRKVSTRFALPIRKESLPM